MCWNGICPDILFPWEVRGEIYATSSTIAYNAVSVDGGLWFKNCVLYGNADPEPNWPYTPRREIGDISHTCVQWKELAGSNGNIDTDPLFADPENGDFRLLPGSPSIDAGGMYLQASIALQDGAATVSWDPGKDLDGDARISGSGPDMGAYEYPGEAPNYLLESSTDLVTWTEEYYGPATSWTDPHANSSRTRFYRVSIGRR